MPLTEEKIKANDNIPSAEIQQDIKETQMEIDSFEKELNVLRENPVQNKLEIYMREGKILKRKEFIENLNQILEYRNRPTEN